MAWMSPSLRLNWGAYFRPEVEDQAKIVNMCRVAIAGNGGQLVPRRNLVQALATVFNIENVDAAMLAIEEETQQAQARALEIAGARHTAQPGQELGMPPQDAGRAHKETPPANPQHEAP